VRQAHNVIFELVAPWEASRKQVLCKFPPQPDSGDLRPAQKHLFVGSGTADLVIPLIQALETPMTKGILGSVDLAVPLSPCHMGPGINR
jgi:hypothetical protein